MKGAIGLAKSQGAQVVSALEERGYIRKLANRARAIEVIRTPSGTPIILQMWYQQILAAIPVCGS